MPCIRAVLLANPLTMLGCVLRSHTLLGRVALWLGETRHTAAAVIVVFFSAQRQMPKNDNLLVKALNPESAEFRFPGNLSHSFRGEGAGLPCGARGAASCGRRNRPYSSKVRGLKP